MLQFNFFQRRPKNHPNIAHSSNRPNVCIVLFYN